MKKRLLSLILALCMIVPMLCVTPVASAAATTSGIYTYTVKNGEVTITKCATSASGSINIPSQIEGKPVVAIDSNAFKERDSIVSVTVPSTVKELGYRAFYGCDALTTLTLSEGLKAIGGDAFNSCSGLKSVVIPNSVTELGFDAFSNCTRMTSVTIGNGVTKIGDAAFSGCTGLKEVIVGSNVKELGDSAFRGCTRLTSISLPFGLVTIGTSAFRSSNSLQSIVLPATVKTVKDNAFKDCAALTSVTFNKGLETIDYAAFRNTGLTSVTLPDTLTTLGGEAFRECLALKSVTIGKALGKISFDAFSGCTALETVKLGYNLVEIGDGAFGSCSSLKTIAFNTKLATIGDGAFRNCTALTTLVLPDSVANINDSAFRGCTGLTKFSGGTGLIHINSSAFRGCTALSQVVLKSIIDIGYQAFYDCGTINKLYLADNLQDVLLDAFKNTTVKDVYYGAPKDEWDFVVVSDGNNTLLNATFHWDEQIYNDVNYTSWYVEALNYCVSKGYFTGTALKTFATKDPLTRSQFVTVLAKLDKANLTEFNYQVFTDVPANKWYTAPVAWAAKNGYVSGIGNGMFGKDNPVTREQIALMFYNYGNVNGVNTSKRADITHFSDYSRIHDWARESLSWAVGIGLLAGTSDTTLDPRGVVTRAQACQIFYQFDQIRAGR